MTRKIFSIGAYGFTKESFFGKLKANDIDAFCDIRLRRGMRGAAYSFANSVNLQTDLNSMGIEYFHYKDLAPSKEIRNLQKEDDSKSKTKKKDRILLSERFIDEYNESCLVGFDFHKMFDGALRDSKNIVFFCVEKSPLACHRSLVLKKIHEVFGFQTEHLLP